MERTTWGVLGVPSSAGAHTPGIERAPAALRAAGLLKALPSAVDHGDVPGFRWRPDPDCQSGQHAGEVARVARDTATAVERILHVGHVPLVVGGDCSITVGVVAGFARAGRPPALLYLDGGPDLFVPATRANGNLDAMGLAHLLALPGHLPVVAGVGPHTPLLLPADVVSFGDALAGVDDHEALLLEELGIARIAAVQVQLDPAAAARDALARLAASGRAEFVVHFDVDVLRFTDTPIADVPDSGGEPCGLTLDEAVAALSVIVADPRCAGLVVTEVNPDHAPDETALRRFVSALAGAVDGARR